MSHFRKSVIAGAVALTCASGAFAMPLTALKFSQTAAFADSLDEFNGAPIGLSFGEFGADVTDTEIPAVLGKDGFNWRGQNYDMGTSEGQSEISIQGFESTVSDAAFNGAFGAATIQGSAIHASSEWVEDEWWVITELTQINRALEFLDFSDLTEEEIAALVPDPLWIVDTIANFRVFDTSDNLLVEDLNSVATFEFHETFNVAAGCDVNIGGTPNCTDEYRASLSTFAPLTPFVIDEFAYSIEFTLIPGPTFDNNGAPFGQTLVCLDDSDPGCDGADVAPGQINVYTPEFDPGESNIYVAARWTVKELPAPSALGLMGIGLIAAGWARRRNNRK